MVLCTDAHNKTLDESRVEIGCCLILVHQNIDRSFKDRQVQIRLFFLKGFFRKDILCLLGKVELFHSVGLAVEDQIEL